MNGKPEHPIDPQTILDWLAAQPEPAWLVGGSVRDRLLGRPLKDIDVAIAGDGLALARRLADRFGGAWFPLDDQRGVGRAVFSRGRDAAPLVVDIARLRAPDILGDLADRDFTINAMALPLGQDGDLIDPRGGREDLRRGVVRVVSDASIRDDPLRALRAIRIAARLGFSLAPETERLLARDGARLTRVSPERVRDELCGLLAQARAAPWLDRMQRLGLLTRVLPELAPLQGLAQSPPHCLEVLEHTLAVVEALEQRFLDWGPLAPFATRLEERLQQRMAGGRSRRQLLKLAALLHDVGKAGTRSVDDDGRIRFFGHAELGALQAREAMCRLRFSRVERRFVETVVRAHLRPILLAEAPRVTRRAIYRFFRDTGDAGIEVGVHALADWHGTCPQRNAPATRLESLLREMFTGYWSRPAWPQRPLLRGDELIQRFGLAPGPRIGELIELLREAQAAGEVRDREQALALVRSVLASEVEGEEPAEQG